MDYYVGLDVSLKQTSICVVDQTGAVVREGVVDSDPEAIAVYVRSKAPDALRIGLETGPTSTWLWTELKQLGLPVICIDARHAKAVLKMPNSNDVAGNEKLWDRVLSLLVVGASVLGGSAVLLIQALPLILHGFP